MSILEKIIGKPSIFDYHNRIRIKPFFYCIYYRDSNNKAKILKINSHSQLSENDLRGIAYKSLGCLITITKISIRKNME